MKQLLLFIFLGTFISGQSQNIIAKLKYEEAMEAFTDKEFHLALSKLDEAENILEATNPKILHLRIVTQHKLIEENELKGFTQEDFKLIRNTIKNAETYLAKYTSIPDSKEKFEDVHGVSEALKKYPVKPELFGEFIKKNTEKRLALLEKNKKLIDSLCTVFKFKKDLTETEFMVFNAEAASMMNKKKQTKNADGSFTYTNSNSVGPSLVTVKDNKVIACSYILKKSTNLSELEAFYNNYNKFLTNRLTFAEIETVSIYDGITNVTYTLKEGYCKLRLHLILPSNIVLLHFELFNTPI